MKKDLTRAIAMVLTVAVYTLIASWGTLVVGERVIRTNGEGEARAIDPRVVEYMHIMNLITINPELNHEFIKTMRDNPTATCGMRYIDEGRDADTGNCLSLTSYGVLADRVGNPVLADKLREIHVIEQSFDNWSPYGIAGDFRIIIDGISAEDIMQSELNVSKFLADTERVGGMIDWVNDNIDSHSKNYPDFRNFVATLEHGRVINADELIEALRIIQIYPPLMPLRLSELQEHFNVIIL